MRQQLSDKAGEVTFFAIGETGLSTGVENHAQRHEEAGHRCEKIVVPCRTLASIFAEIGDRDIHWMKIDVEGMEREVLSGWGTAAVRPWILVIESTLPNSPIENHDEWESLVLERGYAFVYFDGLNRYYVHEDHAGLLTAKSAEAAERAAELAATLRQMQATTAEAVTAWQAQAEGLRAEIERVGVSLSAVQEREREHERAVAERERALAEKERTLADIRRHLAEANETRARLEGLLEEKSRSLADKDLRLSAAIESGARLEVGLEEQKRALTDLEDRLALATEARAQLETVLEEKSSALEERDVSLAAAVDERELLEEKVASLESVEPDAEAHVPYEYELAELERHNRALQAQHRDMCSSTSWRVTAPLRSVSGGVMELRAKARTWLSGMRGSGKVAPPALPPDWELQGDTVGSAEMPVDLSTDPKHVRTLYHRLIHARDNATVQPPADRPARPRLAYLAPQPTEATGIDGYGAELLRELSKHYDIDVIVREVPAGSETNCTVRDIDWFERNAYAFDRTVYQIGNSPLHSHLLPLLERFPGVVLLHDFHLGRMLAAGELGDAFTHALLHSHGYTAVGERFKCKDLSEVIEKYPANLAILQHAQGVIVPSERLRQLAEQYYGAAFASDWIVVPHGQGEPEGAARPGRGKNGSSEQEISGLRMRDAIEKAAAGKASALDARSLAGHVNDMTSELGAEADWLSHARKVTQTVRPKRQRRLYIDVSEIARQDFKTGIQRVVKSQLAELFANPPANMRIEPVFAQRNARRLDYYYARAFVCRLLGLPIKDLDEEPIDVIEGDVFFAADFYVPGVIAAGREGLYDTWRQQGMNINFLVHDLLPIKLGEFFPPENEEQFRKWLSVIVEDAHGLVCTTQATAEDLKAWIAEQQAGIEPRAEIFVCPPGADFKTGIGSRGLPRDAAAVIDALSSRQSFLSVGTIEPRKGYDQTLCAFDKLWASGASFNLVIVGKQGWMVDDLAARLREHPRLGKQLFWLEAISDEYLERIYAACSCLIAASEGEGFGLPLIEAARHKLPIVARGIPVFREVAGDFALYFTGTAPEDLARGNREVARALCR